MFQALLDTGAQRTMISTNVVNTLNLTPVGSIPIQGVGDKVSFHNGYLFHVAFVFPMTSPIPGAAPSRAIYSNLKPIYGENSRQQVVSSMFSWAWISSAAGL
jgi:hypothetical protein